MARPTEPTLAMFRIASRARMLAIAAGFNGGRTDEDGMRTINRCRHFHGHGDVIAVMIFTRDVGMHSSGWWKNADYERCEHLSLSFVDGETKSPAPQDHRLAQLWAKAFFRDYTRLLWIEPPYSDDGKKYSVYHYRLFMHHDWKTPLLPRGEVYTREFTEAGWKSFSELHGDQSQMERDEVMT